MHVIRHPSTDSQHQTIGSTVNTVDTHLQLRHVKTGLLQRRSRRPAQLRPGPSAVRHQRCRTHDSWRAAPRPHHSAPCRPPLTAHPVQAVRTGLPVRSGVRTELPAERHLPGRECGITASPALRVIDRSHRAGDRAFAVAARRAWNSLPDAIRRSPSLAVFKR